MKENSIILSYIVSNLTLSKCTLFYSRFSGSWLTIDSEVRSCGLNISVSYIEYGSMIDYEAHMCKALGSIFSIKNKLTKKMVSRLPKIYIPLACHLRGVSLFQHPKESWWTQTYLNYFISDHSLPILLHTRSLSLPPLC